MSKACLTIRLEGQHDITLHQDSVHFFTVRYGKQSKKKLLYDAAARELGSCIMHALACKGDLDNGNAAERRPSAKPVLRPG